MNKTLEELQSRVKKEHQDIAKFAQHIFEELDHKVEEHRLLTASNALAGINPDGKTEKLYLDFVNETKRTIIDVLMKTTQDFEHQGDKYWDKNFKDGVDQ
ncbi:hypothetical protein ACQKJC_00770 [Priestia koreensis]|uniref:hypothetical protein n=1 Tax=Priestia koreensis TaxID=284581 RepID=UPI003CFD3B54